MRVWYGHDIRHLLVVTSSILCKRCYLPLGCLHLNWRAIFEGFVFTNGVRDTHAYRFEEIDANFCLCAKVGMVWYSRS